MNAAFPQVTTGTMGPQPQSAAPRCVNTLWGAANHLTRRWLGVIPPYVSLEHYRAGIGRSDGARP